MDASVDGGLESRCSDVVNCVLLVCTTQHSIVLFIIHTKLQQGTWLSFFSHGFLVTSAAWFHSSLENRIEDLAARADRN